MDLLGFSVQSGNDNPALAEDGRTRSFLEVRNRTVDAAQRLWSLGARPGEPVAMVLPPSADHVQIFRGLLSLGAVAAPIDPRAPLAEIEERLEGFAPTL